MSKLLTHELYTAVTGKAWTKGAGGQTDGSYAANFALRKDLLAAYRKMSKEEIAAKAVAANTTTTSAKATSEPVAKAEEVRSPVKKTLAQVKAPVSNDIKKSQEARARAVDLRAKGEALIRESKEVADTPAKTAVKPTTPLVNKDNIVKRAINDINQDPDKNNLVSDEPVVKQASKPVVKPMRKPVIKKTLSDIPAKSKDKKHKFNTEDYLDNGGLGRAKEWSNLGTAIRDGFISGGKALRDAPSNIYHAIVKKDSGRYDINGNLNPARYYDEKHPEKYKPKKK